MMAHWGAGDETAFRFDAGRPDNLAPFVGFRRHIGAERYRTQNQGDRGHVREQRFPPCMGQSGVQPPSQSKACDWRVSREPRGMSTR